MSDPLIGKTLGDYTIIELLGRGGMARVYRGYDPKLDRYAAVKVIDAELVPEAQEEYQRRFTREARAIAHLEHPNIVGVYQFGQVGDLNFMAMQFIEGRDLRHILRHYHEKGQQISPRAALRIVRDIALALDHAHSEGVIHRDIKPSNIMVTPEGRAILTDFGLALNMPVGNTFGSAHYIAPEQVESSAKAVPQSDLYALGVVLYEMLTGQVPFDDPSTMSIALKHLQEPPPLPSHINPNLSPALENVILWALRKDPRDRFQSGAELVKALEDAVALQEDDDEEDTVELGDVRAGPGRENGKAPAATPGATLRLEPGPSGPSPAPDVRSSTASLPPPARRSTRRLRLVLVALILAATVALLALQRDGSAPLPLSAWPFFSAAPPLPTPGPGTTPAQVAERSTSPVPSPTEPGTTPTASQAAILLLYDQDALLLINQSEQPADIRQLEFRQQAEGDSPPLVFRAEDWRGGTAPPSALPPHYCFHLWRLDLNASPLEMPYQQGGCAARAAWRMVSAPRWFWVSDSPGATFDVLLASQVLATCEVATGRCAFALPPAAPD